MSPRDLQQQHHASITCQKRNERLKSVNVSRVITSFLHNINFLNVPASGKVVLFSHRLAENKPTVVSTK